MTKVYPNATPTESSSPAVACGGEPAVLTVWKKSLLFNCNGFTVFDAKGNLVFRVDNYASGNRAEIVLMDAVGKPLLTIRRKKLSFGENWLVYDGEESANPKLSVKKQAHLLNSKSLVHVTPCPGSRAKPQWAYAVEGSYSNRSCCVYDDRRRALAEIRRKEAAGGVGFGDDVFRLVVQPGLEAALAMALVILLEQMFGSRGRRGSIIRGL